MICIQKKSEVPNYFKMTKNLFGNKHLPRVAFQCFRYATTPYFHSYAISHINMAIYLFLE